MVFGILVDRQYFVEHAWDHTSDAKRTNGPFGNGELMLSVGLITKKNDARTKKISD